MAWVIGCMGAGFTIHAEDSLLFTPNVSSTLTFPSRVEMREQQPESHQRLAVHLTEIRQRED